MSISAQAIAAHFGLPMAESKPDSSIASSHSIAAVRLHPQTGQRELVSLHWGLVPPRTKEPGVNDRLLYVRAEAVDHKPGLRDAFHSRRCLIPADGFYEWKRERAGKQAYFIRLRTGHLFAFGGLWDRWDNPQGNAIESCVILTTEANELVRLLQPRMPLIVRPEHYHPWLDPHTPIEHLAPLLEHYPAREMTSYPVGPPVTPGTPGEPATMEPMEAHPGEAGRTFHPVFDESPPRKLHRQPSPDRGNTSNA
ncbi:MAG: SOS response-associated peptidase [Bacillota bacterium]